MRPCCLQTLRTRLVDDTNDVVSHKWHLEIQIEKWSRLMEETEFYFILLSSFLPLLLFICQIGLFFRNIFHPDVFVSSVLFLSFSAEIFSFYDALFRLSIAYFFSFYCF